jgi:hypothetical protein
VPFGYHQKVNRRLGAYVMKGDDIIILVDFFGGYLAPYDFTKNAVSHDD